MNREHEHESHIINTDFPKDLEVSNSDLSYSMCVPTKYLKKMC